MFAFLKNHPFAVEAFFESSVVFTFAAPKEALQSLLPSALQLDTFNNCGFVAAAMVQTKSLRPKGFPAILGNDFFLVGYRIFSKYTNVAGRTLRGLYILKSSTDKKRMERLGNIFTHYNYNTIDINTTISGQETRFQSVKSGFEATIISGKEDPSLPLNSPFSDWKEARRYAGPLPFTFTFLPVKQKVLIVEGVRQFWRPEPISVGRYNFPFLETLGLEHIQLASAFMVRNIPYYWKKGKLEKWKA